MTAKLVAALSLVAVFGWSASALAAGSKEAGQAKAATCSACHGMDGNSVNPEWPSLAGQHSSYIHAQLKAFKAGSRQNPLMSPMAMILSDEDISDEARLKALKAGSPGDRATGAQIDAAKVGEAAAQARLDQLIAERDGKATDSFEAAIQQAQTAIDSAKIGLAQTELRAPFAGTIAQLNIEAGELPPRDKPAVVLADLSGWQIETDDVTEIKVPDIKVGQGVTIKLDALPDTVLKGEVESIRNVSQVKSHDVVYPVKIKVLDVEQIAAAWPGSPGWRQAGEPSPHEAHLLRLDCSKARALHGWVPRLGAGDAIAWTVDWYRAPARGDDVRALTLAQVER